MSTTLLFFRLVLHSNMLSKLLHHNHLMEKYLTLNLILLLSLCKCWLSKYLSVLKQQQYPHGIISCQLQEKPILTRNAERKWKKERSEYKYSHAYI